jgi:tetratricopeptide (TPR) repeat protein
MGPTATGQDRPLARQSLLAKARVLEAQGQMGLASHVWHQVLLSDPNNTESLGGLARAAKLAGNSVLARAYLDRLQAIHAKTPEIATESAHPEATGSAAMLKSAGLLQQANDLEQAAGLYLEVLAKDRNNTAAWEGLVGTQHAMKQDQQALQSLETMPPASYAEAIRESSFELTVALVYESQKRLDVAQEILDKLIARQTTAGQKPSVPARLQLAGIYLQRNNLQQAYPIYTQVLAEHPDRQDAWSGLLASLHGIGRNADALVRIHEIPAATLAQLENDTDFLQTVAAIYNGLGQPRQAQVYLRRVQQNYGQQHKLPPADVDIQSAWLLYNGMNDAGLYGQLMALGGRLDLNDDQRRTVQTIWTNWALRCADQAAARGNNVRSLAILNAAARSFPDQPGVIRALAGGYARARLPKPAVMIWQAQDLRSAPAVDYKAAIGAALAASDIKDAETWLRLGLEHYPQNAELLVLGAKVEQTRGDAKRAAAYYRASLNALPAPDPAAELASELSRPVSAAALAGFGFGQELANLLAPGVSDGMPGGQQGEGGISLQPYLPSAAMGYGSGSLLLAPSGAVVEAPVVPAYRTNPKPEKEQTPSGGATHLREVVPQASAADGMPLDSARHSVVAQAMYRRQQAAKQMQQVQRAQPLTAQPVSPSGNELYGSYVPYKSQAAVASTPRPVGTPMVSRMGESKPPVEDYNTAVIENVQYTGQRRNPVQVLSPLVSTAGSNATQPGLKASAISVSSTPQNCPAVTVKIPQQCGDPTIQQYPQPRTASKVVSHSHPPRLSPRTPPAVPAQEVVRAVPAVAQPTLTYPSVSPGIGAQATAYAAPSYALAAPLRGNPGALFPTLLPLTQRQQTERDLAGLEASFSGWGGGIGGVRYRSGTIGLDRLTDFETTAEVSETFADKVRLSIVPKAIFLNSGRLNTSQYQGGTSGVPVLGTLPANAINSPAQQVANGVGGELQVSTRKMAAAVGYTPYEFLVRNVTGRVLYRPTRHFTFDGVRQSVTDTQLSYAGLRDPGSATAVYGGNIWGGVISTGGSVRFELGDPRAGFYVSANGADITGYHVLDNKKFGGAMGAYFLAHNFPNYGRLSIGASLIGAHYAHNERGLSFGQGGYFSPSAYFSGSVPVTFAGRFKNSFHYNIAGIMGVQTFQEDYALFFPLDRGLQNSYASTANGGLACGATQTANHTCAQYPVNNVTTGNYGITAETAYRIAEHWYAGAFILANNTNNYNTVSGGFFVRYLLRPQVDSENSPTGLFPVDGLRPLRLP